MAWVKIPPEHHPIFRAARCPSRIAAPRSHSQARRRSIRVMLPESFMEETDELRRWLARAFEAASALPRKASKKTQAKAKTKSAAAKKKKR